MYAALWRSLPGPARLRAPVFPMPIALAVAACSPRLLPCWRTQQPFTESTVGP